MSLSEPCDHVTVCVLLRLNGHRLCHATKPVSDPRARCQDRQHPRARKNGPPTPVTHSGAYVTGSFADIGQMADNVFISLAKLDHVLWKVTTYLSATQREPGFEFVNHHNCRLGKWYYEGEGQQFFASSPHYASLKRPHEKVHESTKSMFAALDTEPLDYAALRPALEAMETASHDVFACLDQVRDDIDRWSIEQTTDED